MTFQTAVTSPPWSRLLHLQRAGADGTGSPSNSIHLGGFRKESVRTEAGRGTEGLRTEREKSRGKHRAPQRQSARCSEGERGDAQRKAAEERPTRLLSVGPSSGERALTAAGARVAAVRAADSSRSFSERGQKGPSLCCAPVAAD